MGFYQQNKNLIECSFLVLFILQIIFRTLLVLKRSKRNQLPLPFPLFSRNLITHMIRNKTEQSYMYAKNVLVNVTKRKRFFSFPLIIMSQNSNLFCSLNTILKICMRTMSSGILLWFVFGGKKDDPFS